MAVNKRGSKKPVQPRKAEAEKPRKVAVKARPSVAKPAVKVATKKATAKQTSTKAVASPPAPSVRVVKSKPAVSVADERRPLNTSGTTGERPRKVRKQPGRQMRSAKFSVGQIVRHRIYPFRGVVFDIDPVFANTEEWWLAIPADVRPKKDQPFYHLLAENAETEYIAYVSEQNLLADESGLPLRHPGISDYFVENDDGTLRSVHLQSH